MSELEPDERERVEDGTLRLKALEACNPPERLTPFEGYVYQLFQRLSPWRNSGMSGPGSIPWTAVQRALDEEGLSGTERSNIETCLAAMDGAFRSRIAQSAKARMQRSRANK